MMGALCNKYTYIYTSFSSSTILRYIKKTGGTAAEIDRQWAQVCRRYCVYLSTLKRSYCSFCVTNKKILNYRKGRRPFFHRLYLKLLCSNFNFLVYLRYFDIIIKVSFFYSLKGQCHEIFWHFFYFMNLSRLCPW